MRVGRGYMGNRHAFPLVLLWTLNHSKRKKIVRILSWAVIIGMGHKKGFRGTGNVMCADYISVWKYIKCTLVIYALFLSTSYSNQKFFKFYERVKWVQGKKKKKQRVNSKSPPYLRATVFYVSYLEAML